MPLKRNNHFVPSVYLKRWATRGKVPTYRLLVPHDGVHVWKHASLQGIAYHRDLYTYVGREGETDEFESWLDRTFEAPADPVIDRAVRGARLSVEDWQTLVRFAAAQDVRTPRRLQEFLNRQSASLPALIEKTLQQSVRKIESGLLEAHPVETMAAPRLSPDLFQVKIGDGPDGKASVHVEAVVGRRMWIECSRMLLTETLHRLMQHRWTIWRAPPGVTWPTSDNPVLRLNYYGNGRYDRQGGWGNVNGEIMMPLSPTALLYTKVGQRSAPRGTVMPEAQAQAVRRILIENADRLVFDQVESDAPMIRPRRVDAAACEQERVAWENWGSEQAASEREVIAGLTSQAPD